MTDSSLAFILILFPIRHVVWKDTTVFIDQAHLTLQKLYEDRSRWQTEGGLSLSGVSPQLPTVPLPVTHWEAGFSVDDAALRLQAKNTAFGEAVTLVSRLRSRKKITVRFVIGV